MPLVTAPPATDLQIAGLVPLSTVDWPDHLAATVFLQGCPWRCGYCHNTAIIDPTVPGVIDWERVRSLLDARRGLLDGVVFTGGEALRQAALPSAIDEVRARGFKVGLHTAGCYPRRLAEVIDRVSWVGLDIKAMPDDYREVVGANAGFKGWQCLETVLEAGIDYEIRTTVHPGSKAAERFEEIVAALRERGVTTFALQEVRTAGVDAVFSAMADRWDSAAWSDEFARLIDIGERAGFDRFEVRPA
ncbi:MAG: anaerobic ribonucleoside-triphosphate reductase activating protein [Flaviflexus sp.]|nr:anaerobic ribonucleoside-triphosphate reductase activating protein [Flaviflexus sp.]